MSTTITDHLCWIKVKRIVAVFFAVLIVFGLAGCSSSGGSSKPTEPPEEKELTGNAFIDSGIETKYTDAGGNIGKIGRIFITKDAAQEAGMSDFVEFIFSTLEAENYKWFTICFNDHTGIVFYGGSPYNAQYGTYANSDWSMYEPAGNVIFNEKTGEYDYVEFSD